MNLDEAAAQFVDMVKLGSQALQRIAETQIDEPKKAELRKVIDEISEKAEQLKMIIRG